MESLARKITKLGREYTGETHSTTLADIRQLEKEIERLDNVIASNGNPNRLGKFFSGESPASESIERPPEKVSGSRVGTIFSGEESTSIRRGVQRITPRNVPKNTVNATRCPVCKFYNIRQRRTGDRSLVRSSCDNFLQEAFEARFRDGGCSFFDTGPKDEHCPEQPTLSSCVDCCKKSLSYSCPVDDDWYKRVRHYDYILQFHNACRTL